MVEIELALVLRWLHVIGATVLLGTGPGIAFSMVMAHRTGDPHLIAHTAGTVVIADWIFPATAVAALPLSGTLLALEIVLSLWESWIVASLALYVVTGLLWLPVVRIQNRMRDLAREAATRRTDLPPDYHRLFRIWFACGFPAFFAVLAIVWLIVSRPLLWG